MRPLQIRSEPPSLSVAALHKHEISCVPLEAEYLVTTFGSEGAVPAKRFDELLSYVRERASSRFAAELRAAWDACTKSALKLQLAKDPLQDVRDSVVAATRERPVLSVPMELMAEFSEATQTAIAVHGPRRHDPSHQTRASRSSSCKPQQAWLVSGISRGGSKRIAPR
jgi:hypothetical protein